MNDGHELQKNLQGYHGGETIFKHNLVGSFCYTEGVRDFARNAGQGAYWMLDILATEPVIKKLLKEEGFGLVTLDVTGRAGVLQVASDIGVPPVFTRDLDYTDCPECPKTGHSPEGVWKFYLEPSQVGERQVILCMLPQER